MLRCCLKVRDDEQSMMNIGCVIPSTRPSDGNRSVTNVVRGVTGSSRADEDNDRSRRREVTSATG